MNITCFSINPLFPDRVMGGAPKHLQSIAMHLGELGHNVTVLCTAAGESDTPFRWSDAVEVRPQLRFKLPFPQPYDTPAYHLAAVIQDVAVALETADRFYMHDGEFLFPYVYRHVPTVVSLRDSVYPETQLGGFLFEGDTLITISEHSRQYYLNTAGRFFPELAERTVVIHNGIDWDVFRPTLPEEVLEIVPVDPFADAIVIHPHRPEPSKGLLQTIQVADLLVHDHGITGLKVLVPRWLPAGQSADVRDFYQAMESEIDRRGLRDNFLFHDWIPQRLMPQYYSLGAVTLSLGHFVESFGNAVYESLGCGTPAIAARVATHRELLPDDLMDKVHFGDSQTAAELAAEIIRNHRRTSPATLAYLRENYGVARQLDAYAETILGAEKRPPMAYERPGLAGETGWRLAPWCYVWEGGIYHDYVAGHGDHPLLLSLLAAHPDGFSAADAERLGVSPAMCEMWTREGYLVPARPLARR
jgi:glycosyltransferase involved in cell wall biosynthesis